MVEAWIGQPLGFKRGRISHHAARAKSFTVHHGDHTGDARAGSNLRPLKGLNQRQWQGQTTGFHHDAVELISTLEQRLHRGQKLVLHGAAQATVGQFHNAAIELIVRAETATADQLAINANLAEFIHQHRQAQTAVEQQTPQQGGFTSTQKTGHHRDRHARRERSHQSSHKGCPSEGSTDPHQHTRQQTLRGRIKARGQLAQPSDKQQQQGGL